MSFTILYTAEGQPWQVPTAQADYHVTRNGLRRESPFRTVAAQPVPALNPAVATTAIVCVNSDSAARISKGLPGLGTATAKAVVNNRPYTRIEDLIDRVPLPEGSSWRAYESSISFED